MATLQTHGGRRSLYGGADTDVVSTIDAILKLDYIMNKMVDTVNKSTWFLSQITREKMTGGKKFIFTIQTGVAEGQGNRGEGMKLPDYGAGVYEEVSYHVRYQYATMRLTGPAMAVSNKRSAAYASILTNALKDVRNGFTLETYFQTMGKETGVIAKVSGAVTIGAAGDTDEVTFKDPYGLDYSTHAAAVVDQVSKFPFFRIGMQLVFAHVVSGALTFRNIGTVTGIKPDGTVLVKFKDATNLANNDLIIRGDAITTAEATGKSNYGKNYVGLADIVQNSGTYLSLDRTNQPGWQGNVLSVGSANSRTGLLEVHVQGALNEAEVRSDGMNTSPGLLMSNHQAQTIYMSIMVDRKRFVNPPTDLQGGRSALSYNGKPWTVDKICPPQRLYMLNMSTFCWVYFQKPHWGQLDGRILRVPEGYDAATAYMRTYRQVVNEKPQNNTVLQNIAFAASS